MCRPYEYCVITQVGELQEQELELGFSSAHVALPPSLQHSPIRYTAFIYTLPGIAPRGVDRSQVQCESLPLH